MSKLNTLSRFTFQSEKDFKLPRRTLPTLNISTELNICSSCPLWPAGMVSSLLWGSDRQLKRVNVCQHPPFTPSYLLPVIWKATLNRHEIFKRKASERQVPSMLTVASNVLEAIFTVAEESTLGTITLR